MITVALKNSSTDMVPITEALFESNLSGLKLLARGKVRDIYGLDKERLLIITSDRLSAFDVVLPDPIPGKGEVLTAISNFWFDLLEPIIPNHLTHTDPAEHLVNAEDRIRMQNRAVVVKRLRPLPVEAVVRGYLIGSGWKDYCANGSVSGVKLPGGLELAEQLHEPIFTPSTKAAPGAHDENISMKIVDKLIGSKLAQKVEAISLELYKQATEYAYDRGIIIADTKFEFGLEPDGELALIDELFTPDSSRFWPVENYKPGASPQSFDKQYVRDYLERLDWNKLAPGPNLPQIVVKRTQAKYYEALNLLTT
jgi:phosphoribosylaminoimidazole-succinocarboxamide synthase